jgi:hypothetical protein
VEASASSLVCEYLGVPENSEELERTLMQCPLILQVDLSGLAVNEERPLEFRQGPPRWLYIRHSPLGIEKIRITYRGRPLAIFDQSLPADYFKMIARAAHPSSDIQFDEWYGSDRGFLVRLEEVGLFDDDFQHRCQLTFQITQASVAGPFEVSLYSIHLNQILEDRADRANFVMV